MARDNRNLEQGSLDEESLGFLLREEIRGFAGDDFDGSKEEHQIFTELFYGKKMCHYTRTCVDAELNNYESDQKKQSRALVNLDSASSEEFDVCNLNLNQLALSYERLSSFQREQGYCLSDIGNEFPSLKSSKDISKTCLLDLNYMPQQTPFRIVESFCQGIVSSCYFPSHYDETEGHDHIEGDLPSRSNLRNDPITNMKVDDEGKASKIRVSLGSSSPKHLMVDGSNASSMSEESKSLDSDVAEGSKDFVRELPNHLRLHAHNLLLDAGWKFEARRRKDKSKSDSVFKTPGRGFVINSLIKAWRSCGKLLSAGSVTSTQEENSRQWLDIDGFWHDLSDALAYVKKETQDPQSSLSLLDRWHLLDPFMSVVCIDKKISALREGRGVKFVKGRLVELHLNKVTSTTGKSGISAENQPAKSAVYIRSSECLLHCKPGNICTSVSSSPDNAVVGKNVPAMGKPEAVETSCNKKLDCRKNPEFHMQVHYDSKQKHGSGSLNRKVSFGGEVNKRSLKCPAMGIGKVFHLDRRWHNMKHKGSENCSKQKSTSQCVASLIRKSSTLSKRSSAFNVPFSLSVQKSQMELSKQDLMSLDAASTRKSIIHQVKKDIVASDPWINFCMGTQLYEETESSRQTSNHYLKEKTMPYGRNEKCSRACSSGKTYDACNAPKEVEQLEESSCIFPRSSQELGLCFASDGKLTAQNHYAKKEKNNVPGERMKEKMPASADAVKKTEEDILLSPKHRKEEHAEAVKAFKSRQESCSAVLPVNKRANKRSKRISEVAVIKLQHEDVRASPAGKKCEVEIGLDLVDKMSDNFDFPLCREVSWTLMRSENYEVPNESIIKSLGTLESSSDVTEICTAGETHEKCNRVGTRSVKINKKQKKGTQQHIKSANSSLNMGEDQEDREEFRTGDSEHCAEIVTSSEATSTSSLQHTGTKKLPIAESNFRMPAMAACQNKGSVRLQGETGTNEASFLSEMKSTGYQINQRTAKRKNFEAHKQNGRKRHHRDEIDDDDLLVSVVIKTKGLSSDNKLSSCNSKTSRPKGCRKHMSQKGSCKLRLRMPGKNGIYSITGARTPLAWLLNSGVVSLNSSVQCRSPKNNAVLKDGRVTREGILCKCCVKTLSVSDFKCHAGYRLNRSSLNLFLESGKSYTLCQLQAWSDEYKARKYGKQVSEVVEVDQNDDTCGLCGDGGELICCDNCPSTFHQACLHSQDIPEGHWYCPNCTCKICGDAVVAKMILGSFTMLECSQCEQKYHDICLKKGSSNDGSPSDTWFCGGTCEKVYFGLRSRVGVMNSIADGFSWTILRCNHSDPRVQSAQKIALMADCNCKLAVALKIMEECFLPIVDPRTGINMIPQVLYNWGSNFPRLNYHGFYTIILEKDDNIISVATIRVHGVTVAEMPLIATCTEQRRQGMCRRLMGAIEEVLKSFNVEMLVLCAIPDLIDTWTSGFGFKPITDDEKRRLCTINLMLFPGTALLTKNLGEALEMKKPEDEKLSSAMVNNNHEVNFCARGTDFMTSQQPGLDSFTTRVDPAVGTTPWICMNLEPCEQEDCQQPNLPASPCSNVHTVVAETEPEYFTNIGSCNATSNISGGDQLTDPGPSAACKEITDVGGSTSGNIGTILEHKMIDRLQSREFMTHPSKGDETGDVKTTRNSERKSDCNMLETIHPLNLNNLSVSGINDVSASIHVSTQCKLLASTAMGWLPAVGVHNPMDFTVDFVNRKGDSNHSTLVGINEARNPCKHDLESTGVAPNQFVAPLSVAKYNRVPQIFSEGNVQENVPCGICLSVMGENVGKKGPYYTPCDGQERETLKMKVGFLPERDTIMNSTKATNLSQKTVSNSSETALAEGERS